MTDKQREKCDLQRVRAVFLIGIGGKLSDGNRTMCVRRIMMTGQPYQKAITRA